MRDVHAFAGAIALLLALALLCRLRAATALLLTVAQSAVVAIAAIVQGAASDAIPVALAGVVGLALNAAVPFVVLHRRPAVDARSGSTGVVLMAAAGLTAVAIALGNHLDTGPHGQLIGLALSILLIGLLRAALSASPSAAALGLLASQNGMLLAAAAMPDLPPLALLAAAMPIVPALVATGTRPQAS